MEIDVDPLVCVKLTMAQLREQYVSIDQMPDPGLDPLQALIQKEEGNPDEQCLVKGDPRDIGRPESYVVSEVTTSTSSTIVNNGQENGHTFLHIEDLAEMVERMLRDTPVTKFRLYQWDSHGKRGRKPIYKDKAFPHYVW